MSTRVTHHPSEDVLLAYAIGHAEEAIALMVATHLTFCPACRRFVRQQEDGLAAGLLGHAPEPVGPGQDDQDEPVEHDEQGAARLERALDAIDLPPEDATATPSLASPPLLEPYAPPRTLLPYLPPQSRWRFIGPGVRGLDLDVSCGGQRARLVRFRPGYRIPLHTHQGSEWVLVLHGGLTDQEQHYVRGDVDQKDASVVHEVKIDRGEVCLALVVLDAPLRAKTVLGKLLQRLSGY
jgi:putative transcriptional regulator